MNTSGGAQTSPVATEYTDGELESVRAWGERRNLHIELTIVGRIATLISGVGERESLGSSTFITKVLTNKVVKLFMWSMKTLYQLFFLLFL